jgi:aminoglycoside-2''-adenylyltransferase
MHPDDAEWAPWRPEDAASALAGLEAPWAVAAGWAVDLFLGAERREHEDLEVALPAVRFAEAAERLSGLDFHVVAPGTAVPVGAAAGLLETHHQTWGLDRAAYRWRIDVFREPSEGDTWICRRDGRIRLPYAELIEHTDDGIPYVRPEVVLLFKAKQARPKDEGDLAAVLPRLGASRRRLLAGWVELVHPGHFWLPDLG